MNKFFPFFCQISKKLYSLVFWILVISLMYTLSWKSLKIAVLKDSKHSRESMNSFKHSKIVLFIKFTFPKKKPCQTDWRPQLRTLKHLLCSIVTCIWKNKHLTMFVSKHIQLSRKKQLRNSLLHPIGGSLLFWRSTLAMG